MGAEDPSAIRNQSSRVQRLPLPVGSPHPVRRLRRVPRLAGRGGAVRVLIGLVATAAGGLLGALPPTVAVAVDRSGYHVAGVTLPPRGAGVYAGPEGAIVVAGRRAAGSTTLHGAPMVGSCEVATDGRRERCQFEIGGRRVAADDTLDGGGWTRRYDDGQVVRIELRARQPVPVPIAIGR